MLTYSPYPRLFPHPMREGTLEVVIVSAKGIGHTNIIGRPAYFVNIECGNQVRKSRVSKKANHVGKTKEIIWNEKFTFDFPSSELKNLSHLKFKLMDENFFTDGGSVGETIVHLKGIVAEGNDKGEYEIRPTPYNVVLEDDTYKGEIKIGLKFISKREVSSNDRALVKEEEDLRKSICKTVINACRVPWWRLLSKLSLLMNTKSKDKPKQI